MQSLTFLWTFWVFSAFLFHAECTLTPRSLKHVKRTEEFSSIVSSKNLSKNGTVFTKKLVIDDVKVADIISNYNSFHTEVDDYVMNGLVLGYVTPWNNHGYNITKIFGNKFTHISPTWLQMSKPSGLYQLSGLQDVDREWMQHARNSGRTRGTKIVPRVTFEEWTQADFMTLLDRNSAMKQFTKHLIESCVQMKFDGYVLEIWTNLVAHVGEQFSVQIVKSIGKALLSKHLDLILVIPPKRKQFILFGHTHFMELRDSVTAFSLMTYDFSVGQYKPGPNAPTSWMEDSIRAICTPKEYCFKILTGLNFYGYKYQSKTSQPLINSEYIKQLKTSQCAIKYLAEFGEHLIICKSSKSEEIIIYYPTLYSIHQRLEMCRALGTGVSIWELGQGLDYFYDLL